MARPKKKGLDYFPCDVIFDDSVDLLEAECGLEGLAILIKLWQKIYQRSYYTEWDEDIALLFSKKINSELNTVNTIVNVCLRRNIFDKFMYEQHSILTSSGIQKRYLEICQKAKRSDYEINSEFNLVNSEFTRNKPQLPQEESAQSKVKKSKTKKSKTNESKEEYTGLSFVTPTVGIAPGSDSNFKRVINSYQQNIQGNVPQVVVQSIINWMTTFDEDMMVRAIEITAKKQATFNYMEAILNNWQTKGYTTLADVDNDHKGKKKESTGNPFLDLMQEEFGDE